MEPTQKKYMIIGGVVILLLIVGWLLFGRSSKKTGETKELLPTEMAVPTVESSVKVDLVDAGNGKEVSLSVTGIPSGTKSIDYELSYNTASQGLQGVIGTINLKNDEKNYEKKITLGTCSSGSCVYHQVVGKIKLDLKFTGDYGEKVFNKDYTL